MDVGLPRRTSKHRQFQLESVRSKEIRTLTIQKEDSLNIIGVQSPKKYSDGNDSFHLRLPRSSPLLILDYQSNDEKIIDKHKKREKEENLIGHVASKSVDSNPKPHVNSNVEIKNKSDATPKKVRFSVSGTESKATKKKKIKTTKKTKKRS